VFFGKDLVSWLISTNAGTFQVASKTDAVAVGASRLRFPPSITRFALHLASHLFTRIAQATPCSSSSWRITASMTIRLKIRTSITTGIQFVSHFNKQAREHTTRTSAHVARPAFAQIIPT
jgi:hypothetical protein